MIFIVNFIGDKISNLIRDILVPFNTKTVELRFTNSYNFPFIKVRNRGFYIS